MCGIVGLVQRETVSPELLDEAARQLWRRGPDDAGVWCENGAGLGHRRLSVLDPSSAGHQPMVSPDGRYVIVFNGEIYNHMEVREELGNDGWRGHSDTETVLIAFARWGSNCLGKFHGMFAFAIWDRREKQLFAARDRMGEKPFYYHHAPGVFAFASRPRALFRILPGLSPEYSIQGLRYYLQSGYFPARLSVYEAVSKLPPGHFLWLKEGVLDISAYWSFQEIEPCADWRKRSEDDLLDELDEILSNSVRSRLISDVPLGAFLSGGIDSSLIVAMMRRHTTQPVRTFTIGFDLPEYDESRDAEEVADYLGTDHRCEILRTDDLLDLLPLFSEEYDEPFFDSSCFPAMAVSRLARQDVTVALGGDGGDELFGGYHYYSIAKALRPFFLMPALIRRGLSAMVGQLPGHRTKLLAGALRENTIDNAFAFSRSIAKDFDGLMPAWAVDDTTDMRELFAQAGAMVPSSLDAAERGMRLDAMFTLPDDYLQKIDLASMAFSLEVREPMLDQDVVEWAMRLPVPWKLKGKMNKYLLRRLAYRYIPENILNRPKRGFGVPIDHWLRGPLCEWASSLLNDESLFEGLPVSQSGAQRLFMLHKSGARNISALLWAILMLLNFVSGRGMARA